MLISIIIPAYNGENFIGATIESVLTQTHADWEMIVVDDGSRDATATIAAKFADTDSRIRVILQANTGTASGARNRGSLEATPNADYILFLDHDDVLEPDALALLSHALQDRPEAVAAYGLARYIDAEGKIVRGGEAEAFCRRRKSIEGERLATVPVEAPLSFSSLAFTNCLNSPGQILIRKKSFDLAGPWDLSVSPSSDRDMWIRLSLLGELHFVNQIVFNHRQHHYNQSHDRNLMKRGDLKVRQKWSQSPALSEAQRRTIVSGWRLWDRRIVGLRLYWGYVDLKKGDLRGALKNVLRAIRSLSVYISRWGLWRSWDYQPKPKLTSNELPPLPLLDDNST